jgi:hypothetical protein
MIGMDKRPRKTSGRSMDKLADKTKNRGMDNWPGKNNCLRMNTM